MVKSYVAARPKQAKQKDQKIKVRDFMVRKLITFHPEDSMHLVITTLVKHGISGAPVVDGEGRLIGVISEGDCLKQVVRGKYLNSPELVGKVKDYMTSNPNCVTPEENILEVANKFLERRLRRFPVLENGKLVGQISQRDVLFAIEELEHTQWRR